MLGNVLDIGTPSDSTVTDAKANFVSTSSAAGLQIKGDGTTDGTLQLNCSQNSHGVKIASPAHSAGQSYTLTLPTGNLTAGNVLKINSISGSGTTAVGQLEAPSELTMPNQPAFLAHPTSTTGDMATGATNSLPFATERFDQGSDYNNSTYLFTAPITGKYQANVILYLVYLDSAVQYYELLLSTSNKIYYSIIDPDFGQDNVYFCLNLSLLVDMDSGDTAGLNYVQQGGSTQTRIASLSMWSMHLVC